MRIFIMIKRKKTSCTLTIVFIILSLLSFGFIINQTLSSQSVSEEFVSDNENKQFFSTGELMGDSIYYQYMNDETNAMYKKLLTYRNKLLSSDNFRYIIVNKQHIDFEENNTKIPDIFLQNYESGDYETSNYQFEGKKYLSLKTLSVNNSFFDEFNIDVKEGRCFSDEDYYKNDKIPVILGSAYNETFKIGDEFFAGYSDTESIEERNKYIVVGFLKEESFYYDSLQNDYVSCERYILIPSYIHQIPTTGAKRMMLQQMSGIIVTRKGYDDIIGETLKYQKELGITDWGLYINNPNKSYNVNEVYGSMTKVVANQFFVISVLILAFGSIVISIEICSILKDNFYMFGVEMLCGASFKNIFLNAFQICSFLLIFGDLVAVMIMGFLNVDIRSMVLSQCLLLLIMIITTIFYTIYLKKMDVSNIIGGNE